MHFTRKTSSTNRLYLESYKIFTH